MRKILTLIAALSLVASLAVGGSIAYLSDTDSENNVMTVGRVTIDLIEQQRSDNGSELVDFKPNNMLMPIVGSAQGEKDKWGLATAENLVDKIVSVENTGNAPAWVRILVAVPAALEADPTPEDNSVDQPLHWNVANRFDVTGNGTYNSSDAGNPYSAQFTLTYGENMVTTIDNVKYNVYAFTRKQPLPAGETSAAVMTGFYLDANVDYDNDNGYYTYNGEKVDYYGETVVIPVFAQAVQAAGFDTAEAAFTSAKMTTDPWAGMSFTNVGEIVNGVVSIDSDKALVDESLYINYNTSENVTIEGNGNTVTLTATKIAGWGDGTKPENGIVFGSEKGSNVATTVNDLTITGDVQSIMTGYYMADTSSDWFTTNMNNVNIVDVNATGSAAYVCSGLSVYGTANLKNCTVTGTKVSPLYSKDLNADGLTLCDVLVVNNAKLIATDSEFGVIDGGKQGTNHYYGKSYIELNNSTAEMIFACGRTQGGATVINSGSRVGKIVASNYGITLTIAEGAVVDTLELTAIDPSRISSSKITINGTVNKIVDSGISYDSYDAWLAAQ